MNHNSVQTKQKNNTTASRNIWLGKLWIYKLCIKTFSVDWMASQDQSSMQVKYTLKMWRRKSFSGKNIFRFDANRLLQSTSCYHLPSVAMEKLISVSNMIDGRLIWSPEAKPFQHVLLALPQMTVWQYTPQKCGWCSHKCSRVHLNSELLFSVISRTILIVCFYSMTGSEVSSDGSERDPLKCNCNE